MQLLKARLKHLFKYQRRVRNPTWTGDKQYKKPKSLFVPNAFPSLNGLAKDKRQIRIIEISNQAY